MSVELVQLEDFLAVLAHGGFTPAAAMRGRSQQALSKSLAGLEKELGTTLFDRVHRQPTDNGELLQRHARRAIQELQCFTAKLRAEQDVTPAAVRLGASPTPAAGLVGEAVLSVAERQPHLRVNVVTGLRQQLLEELTVGRLDLCICVDTDSSAAPGLQREALGQQAYGVIANANHPLCRKRTCTSRDLARNDWILGTNLGSVEEAWRESFTQAGLAAPIPTLVTSSLEFCRNALRSSDRLSVLPLTLVEADLDRGDLRVLAVPGFQWQRPLALYRRRGAAPQTALLEALRRSAERENRLARRTNRND
jgi:DNA-binding transcriptional LysR family regulator